MVYASNATVYDLSAIVTNAHTLGRKKTLDLRF
jgi:hypothetical protein